MVNVLFSRLICTSRKNVLFCFSISIVNYMLACQPFRKFRKDSNSFAFAEGIVEQHSEFFMGSLDADSLFTNIPIEETIDICANTLF